MLLDCCCGVGGCWRLIVLLCVRCLFTWFYFLLVLIGCGYLLASGIVLVVWHCRLYICLACAWWLFNGYGMFVLMVFVGFMTCVVCLLLVCWFGCGDLFLGLL